MDDLLPILVLAIIGVTAGALFDCATTDPQAIRHFPKNLWLISILLLPGVGGVMWFTSGRQPAGLIPGQAPSAVPSSHPAGRGRVEPTAAVDVVAPRTVAPDDDPEFLARLAEMNRVAKASDSGVGLTGTGGRGGSDTLHDEERLRQWEADLRRREEQLRERDEPPSED